MNVLVCYHCKYSRNSVVLLGHSDVLHNVLYLDITCDYSNDPSQFIGWEDFNERNNVLYDNVFLMNCPMYSEIKDDVIVSGFNVWDNVMSDALFYALKPSGQMIFPIDAEFENGVRRMLNKYNRSNDFDVTIKEYRNMDFIAINNNAVLNNNYHENVYCILTKNTYRVYSRISIGYF